jgi:DNA-binding response OmpR family regulator
MQTLKIVIVEDEPAIRMLYQKKFELEGFTAITANDGYEGLHTIRQSKPDIILLDLRMPRMNGDEMLTKMRATEWGAEARVMILTNLSRSEAPSSLRFLNVERYIVKANHTPAQVVAMVREVLGVSG